MLKGCIAVSFGLHSVRTEGCHKDKPAVVAHLARAQYQVKGYCRHLIKEPRASIRARYKSPHTVDVMGNAGFISSTVFWDCRARRS